MRHKYKRIIGVLLIVCCLAGTTQAQITIKTTPVTGCNRNDGTAIVTVNTSVTDLELEYAVDGGGWQTSGEFTDLAEGKHVAQVRDRKTDCTFSKDFDIDEMFKRIQVTITGLGATEVCSNSPSVTLRATVWDGSGDYTVSWPGGIQVVTSSGRYTVNATDNKTGCKASLTGDVVLVPVICAKDPNDIVGPEGYGPGKMIARSKAHNYMIRFENDPEFATAPAQIVKINHPLHANVNPYSLRLGDFGFGGIIFTVPPDKTYYSSRLNLMDSLGVVVDVTAGIDITKREAFWIFESKDPRTGLPPADATLGFLPVNDSSSKGEGFVTYTIKPGNTTKTGDSIYAQASIVFDINAPLETPVIFNTIDALPPVSVMNVLPPASPANTITLKWTGQDDAGGSGVRDYTVFVSENGGVFKPYQSGITAVTTTFTGVSGNTYGFFTQATDNVGNQEPLKNLAETSISITGNCTAEECNGIDDDCDGQIDEDFLQLYFPDVDGDGYGATTGGIMATSCNAPKGYVTDNTDCNDNDRNSHPHAREICDGLDNDCDGLIDELMVTHRYYPDADGDGYGGNNSIVSCDPIPPAGYVAVGGDCDDSNKLINPGAPDVCNGIDDNCNGLIDEDGCLRRRYYFDEDRDGYGNDLIFVETIRAPAGYVPGKGDCDDKNAAIHPNAIELPNGIDDNCNGQIDEDIITTSNARSEKQVSEVQPVIPFSMVISPVPSSTVFNLHLEGGDAASKIKIQVYDVYGRLVEVRNNCSPGQQLTIGGTYGKGVYVVEAVQGNKKLVKKIVKL